MSAFKSVVIVSVGALCASCGLLLGIDGDVVPATDGGSDLASSDGSAAGDGSVPTDATGDTAILTDGGTDSALARGCATDAHTFCADFDDGTFDGLTPSTGGGASLAVDPKGGAYSPPNSVLTHVYANGTATYYFMERTFSSGPAARLAFAWRIDAIDGSVPGVVDVAYITRKDGDGGATVYTLVLTSDRAITIHFASSDGANATGGGDYDTGLTGKIGVWTHVEFDVLHGVDGGTMAVSLDGNQQFTTPVGREHLGGPVTIGVGAETAYADWTYRFDDVTFDLQ